MKSEIEFIKTVLDHATAQANQSQRNAQQHTHSHSKKKPIAVKWPTLHEILLSFQQLVRKLKVDPKLEKRCYAAIILMSSDTSKGESWWEKLEHMDRYLPVPNPYPLPSDSPSNRSHYVTSLGQDINSYSQALEASAHAANEAGDSIRRVADNLRATSSMSSQITVPSNERRRGDSHDYGAINDTMYTNELNASATSTASLNHEQTQKAIDGTPGTVSSKKKKQLRFEPEQRRVSEFERRSMEALASIVDPQRLKLRSSLVSLGFDPHTQPMGSHASNIDIDSRSPMNPREEARRFKASLLRGSIGENRDTTRESKGSKSVRAPSHFLPENDFRAARVALELNDSLSPSRILNGTPYRVRNVSGLSDVLDNHPHLSTPVISPIPYQQSTVRPSEAHNVTDVGIQERNYEFLVRPHIKDETSEQSIERLRSHSHSPVRSSPLVTGPNRVFRQSLDDNTYQMKSEKSSIGGVDADVAMTLAWELNHSGNQSSPATPSATVSRYAADSSALPSSFVPSTGFGDSFEDVTSSTFNRGLTSTFDRESVDTPPPDFKSFVRQSKADPLVIMSSLAKSTEFTADQLDIQQLMALVNDDSQVDGSSRESRINAVNAMRIVLLLQQWLVCVWKNRQTTHRQSASRNIFLAKDSDDDFTVEYSEQSVATFGGWGSPALTLYVHLASISMAKIGLSAYESWLRTKCLMITRSQAVGELFRAWSWWAGVGSHAHECYRHRKLRLGLASIQAFCQTRRAHRRRLLVSMGDRLEECWPRTRTANRRRKLSSSNSNRLGGSKSYTRLSSDSRLPHVVHSDTLPGSALFFSPFMLRGSQYFAKFLKALATSTLSAVSCVDDVSGQHTPNPDHLHDIFNLSPSTATNSPHRVGVFSPPPWSRTSLLGASSTVTRLARTICSRRFPTKLSPSKFNRSYKGRSPSFVDFEKGNSPLDNTYPTDSGLEAFLASKKRRVQAMADADMDSSKHRPLFTTTPLLQITALVELQVIVSVAFAFRRLYSRLILLPKGRKLKRSLYQKSLKNSWALWRAELHHIRDIERTIGVRMVDASYRLLRIRLKAAFRKIRLNVRWTKLSRDYLDKLGGVIRNRPAFVQAVYRFLSPMLVKSFLCWKSTALVSGITDSEKQKTLAHFVLKVKVSAMKKWIIRMAQWKYQRRSLNSSQDKKMHRSNSLGYYIQDRSMMASSGRNTNVDTRPNYNIILKKSVSSHALIRALWKFKLLLCNTRMYFSSSDITFSSIPSPILSAIGTLMPESVVRKANALRHRRVASVLVHRKTGTRNQHDIDSSSSVARKEGLGNFQYGAFGCGIIVPSTASYRGFILSSTSARPVPITKLVTLEVSALELHVQTLLPADVKAIRASLSVNESRPQQFAPKLTRRGRYAEAAALKDATPSAAQPPKILSGGLVSASAQLQAMRRWLLWTRDHKRMARVVHACRRDYWLQTYRLVWENWTRAFREAKQVRLARVRRMWKRLRKRAQWRSWCLLAGSTRFAVLSKKRVIRKFRRMIGLAPSYDSGLDDQNGILGSARTSVKSTSVQTEQQTSLLNVFQQPSLENVLLFHLRKQGVAIDATVQSELKTRSFNNQSSTGNKTSSREQGVARSSNAGEGRKKLGQLAFGQGSDRGLAGLGHGDYSVGGHGSSYAISREGVKRGTRATDGRDSTFFARESYEYSATSLTESQDGTRYGDGRWIDSHSLAVDPSNSTSRINSTNFRGRSNSEFAGGGNCTVDSRGREYTSELSDSHTIDSRIVTNGVVGSYRTSNNRLSASDTNESRTRENLRYDNKSRDSKRPVKYDTEMGDLYGPALQLADLQSSLRQNSSVKGVPQQRSLGLLKPSALSRRFEDSLVSLSESCDNMRTKATVTKRNAYRNSTTSKSFRKPGPKADQFPQEGTARPKANQESAAVVISQLLESGQFPALNRMALMDSFAQFQALKRGFRTLLKTPSQNAAIRGFREVVNTVSLRRSLRFLYIWAQRHRLVRVIHHHRKREWFSRWKIILIVRRQILLRKRFTFMRMKRRVIARNIIKYSWKRACSGTARAFSIWSGAVASEIHREKVVASSHRRCLIVRVLNDWRCWRKSVVFSETANVKRGLTALEYHSHIISPIHRRCRRVLLGMIRLRSTLFIIRSSLFRRLSACRSLQAAEDHGNRYRMHDCFRRWLRRARLHRKLHRQAKVGIISSLERKARECLQFWKLSCVYRIDELHSSSQYPSMRSSPHHSSGQAFEKSASVYVKRAGALHRRLSQAPIATRLRNQFVSGVHHNLSNGNAGNPIVHGRQRVVVKRYHPHHRHSIISHQHVVHAPHGPSFLHDASGRGISLFPVLKTNETDQHEMLPTSQNYGGSPDRSSHESTIDTTGQSMMFAPANVKPGYVSISGAQREMLLLSHLSRQKYEMLRALVTWRSWTHNRRFSLRHFEFEASTRRRSMIPKHYKSGVIVRSYFQEWLAFVRYRDARKSYDRRQLCLMHWRRTIKSFRDRVLQKQLQRASETYYMYQKQRRAIRHWRLWMRGRPTTRYRHAVSYHVGMLADQGTDPRMLHRALLSPVVASRPSKHGYDEKYRRYWLLCWGYRKLRTQALNTQQLRNLTMTSPSVFVDYGPEQLRKLTSKRFSFVESQVLNWSSAAVSTSASYVENGHSVS